jgi:hypothetical protein
MLFTAEQKSQLAKLMATENLTVEHQKIQTARFDPQNRVLYLPIWQNMTGALYDLLCGHEVGHALYTPASGWHDAVADESKGKHYKSFLNVVEDARIEKKVKRKYPGLTKQFKEAYNDLMKRDFFGLRERDINTMAFIERLNIYSKSQYTMPVEFSAQEEILVKKVQACETWDDVVRVTDEVYGYSKDEQYEMMLQDFQSFDYSDEYGDDDYDNYDGDGYDGDDYEQNDSVKSKSGNNGENSDEEADKDNDGDANGEQTDKQSKSKSNSESSDSQGESTEDNESDGESSFNRYKDSEPASRDMFNPKCETDDSYRANEVLLLDEKCKEYLYLTFPKPIFENIITPAKRVQELLTKHYQNEVTQGYLSNEKVKSFVNDFKTKNDRYIGLLAKEFEMRKAAKAFSKSKLSDTGDIDINKLASYKFDDNIFRKVMLTPKGKSHGLVLLLDRSGSMSNNMAGSIEQILVLAMFCRKVNIPFVMYGFGDSVDARYIDLGLTTYEQQYDYNKSKKRCFEQSVKSMGFDTVFLREYINSKMTNAEFNAALRNMILLKKSYEGGRYRSECGRPESEHLSNTPLTQAIVATAELMKKFKVTNNLDMTSLVIVHDGDSDWTNYYNNEVDYPTENGGTERKVVYNSIDTYSKNVIFRDTKNNFEMKITGTRNRDIYMQVALEWFRKVTGSKVFGFFLIPDSRPSWVRGTISHRYVLEDGKTYAEKIEEVRKDPNRWNLQHQIDETVKQVAKQLKTEKFLVSNTPGFNSFFLVSGGDDLKTESDEIEIEGKVTANKLKTAFMKMNKKKQINRVLVSKFIQGIAA